MRQLTTFPSADTAQALADYLLTLKINTQLQPEPEGWAIWVCDEDHLPRARQELEEFQRNPSDPRYQGAASTAAQLRKQKQREEKAYHRRQERFYARMGAAGRAGGVTITLIAISVIVLVLKDGFSFGGSLLQTLLIAPYGIYRVEEFDPQSGEWSSKTELRSPGLQPILHGQIWRLVTPIFLHFGIWHLLFNMLMLYDLGGVIERRRGRWRYLFLVLVLAISSNLVQYFLGHPVMGGAEIVWRRSPNFGGMSGVVYGLFGYVWMKARFQPELGFRIHPNTVIYLVAWFFLCMTGWVGPIANGAHAGGLVSGMILGYVPTLWKTTGSA